MLNIIRRTSIAGRTANVLKVLLVFSISAVVFLFIFLLAKPSENRFVDRYVKAIAERDYGSAYSLLCAAAQAEGYERFSSSVDLLGRLSDADVRRGSDSSVRVVVRLNGRRASLDLRVVRTNGKRIPCPSKGDSPLGSWVQ